MMQCVNLTQGDQGALLELSLTFPLAIAYSLFCLISLVVSLINVAVLTRPRMLRTDLNLLLAALEFANLTLSVLHIPLILVRILGRYSFRPVVAFLYVLDVQIIWVVVFFIIWMAALISGWRYLAVAHPLSARTWLRRSRAVAAISFLVVFCLILLGVQFLGFRFEHWYPSKNCSVVLLPDIYEQIWSSFTRNQRISWGQVYVVLNLLYYLVPVGCFLTTHVLLVRKLWQRRATQKSLQEVPHETRETRSNIILATLLFTFIVAYAPPCLLVAVQICLEDCGVQVPLPWQETFWEFIPGFVINTTSFGGYYYMSPAFKDTFLEMIRGARLFKKIRSLFCHHPENISEVRKINFQVTETSLT